MNRAAARRALPWIIAIAAGLGGTLVALHYNRLGLTLSHYDARGHLVVARRIFDSLTPGWQQIGAVWLPLPHLLNALPVQIDAFYRSGASAVAISIISFAIAAGSIAAIVLTLTESASAAAAAAAVVALNPNVLYLQSTPMSEPLLLALTTLGVALLTGTINSAPRVKTSPRARLGIYSIVCRGRASASPSPGLKAGRYTGVETAVVGIVFALACLTRYEAWPVTVAALIAAAYARWRQGDSLRDALSAVARIAIYPAVAIAGFIVFSRVVVGAWFVSSGFFVPENKAIGDAVMAAKEIGWGVQTSSGRWLTDVGGVGTALMVALAIVSRRRASWLIPVSLLGMATIPWTAFVDGHPFRLRYAVPLVAMEAIGAGALAGCVPRAAIAGAILLASLTAMELRPLDASAPMVVEAQWDQPNRPARARVTACLGAPGSGDKIMASMGSLGHYMQETSHDGYAIRDFLHEGNGDIWLAALDAPYRFADWLLIEEKAEGGDMLARISRERPAFLDGFVRVCDGAGLALYKRRGEPRRDEDRK